MWCDASLLKGQSHQDLVLLENPKKVLALIGTPLIVAWGPFLESPGNFLGSQSHFKSSVS